MSIAILNQVYDEVRRLAIAGSSVAPGDFRLKKLIPPLEQAGKKSPVFAKVAEATTALVDSDEKKSSVALLELGTLINSILYTQGETTVDGPIEPIETKDFGLAKTQTSAKLLKPLLEALTSTGSGRLEIIRDAQHRGLFRDLRLIRPALMALDDTYSEIADLIANEVLPIYGSAILPELEAQFDAKGKIGQTRRLALMHRIDPIAARPHVDAALEEGSKELRVAAISCLGTSPTDLSILLTHAKAKAKDVRSAALQGLGRLSEKGAIDALISVIESSDLEIAIEPLRDSRVLAVQGAVVRATSDQVDRLLQWKDKDKTKTGQEVQRMLLLLRCLSTRHDAEAEQALLNVLGHREHWLTIKSEPGGVDLLELLTAILSSGSPKMQKSLIGAHAQLPVECLRSAFEAACWSHEPDEVFSTFSPYVLARSEAQKRDGKKKGKDPNVQRADAIIAAICADFDVSYHRIAFRHVAEQARERDLTTRVSPKWLDLAIEHEIKPLILKLARPGHHASHKALSHVFQEAMNKKAKDAYEISHVLDAFICVEHPGAVDATIAAITEFAKSSTHYGMYWLTRLLTRLPKAEAIPKLEALLPTLPDKVASHLVDHLVVLKQS